VSEPSSGVTLRRSLPAIILVTVVACGLGGGYYFAYADSSQPKVSWQTNPLKITFASQAGSGMGSDSFTCSQTVSPVTLKATSNQPDTVSLTVSPSSFPSCGSSPDNVFVTAACASVASESCVGNFTGRVNLCGPTPYTCLPSRMLVVIIRVTSA